MSEIYTEGEIFDGDDFTEKTLPKGEYENCRFVDCKFANSDLSAVNFIECAFEQCDLSMAKISGTAFQDVQFKGCKLLGLHFENAKDFLFAVNFENCQLKLSSFYKRSLKQIVFKNCNLQEVDFAEADLNRAIFENCDLENAMFDNTNLEKADFRIAYNFTINPETNRIKKAKFSMAGLAGLLGKYDIEIE